MALCVMAQTLPEKQQKNSKGLLIQMPSHHSSADTKTEDASTLLSIVLIVFESLLTFLLRHDTNSQRLAERLVVRQAVIRIRTHLPAYTFYATFSHHGVLLDHQQPETEYLATVDSSIPSLFRAFMTARPAILDSILIHGDEELVCELRELMKAFNLSHILNNWFSFPWFKRSSAKSQPDAPKQQRVKPLLKRIDEQKKQIEQLNVTLKQQAHRLEKQQAHYKTLLWTSSIAMTVLLTVIVVLLLR